MRRTRKGLLVLGEESGARERDRVIQRGSGDARPRHSRACSAGYDAAVVEMGATLPERHREVLQAGSVGLLAKGTKVSREQAGMLRRFST